MKLFKLFGRPAPVKKPTENVTSVETMTLTLRGMRGGNVYRLETEGENTRLCHYHEKYRGGETVLDPCATVACTPCEIISLMNRCRVIDWDGFHGDHPKNVLDGTMFTFSSEVNGGRRIYADGSANFPTGYREFVAALREMLSGVYKY